MLDGGVGENVNDILSRLNNIRPLQGNTYIKYCQSIKYTYFHNDNGFLMST